MISFETAFLILVIFYAISTPLYVFLVESRLKEMEKENETLIVECIKLKKRINNP